MLERRYKDYDERFAKDQIFYASALEISENKSRSYIYSDPECTVKVSHQDLKKAFLDGMKICVTKLSDAPEMNTVVEVIFKPDNYAEETSQETQKPVYFVICPYMSEIVALLAGDSSV